MQENANAVLTEEEREMLRSTDEELKRLCVITPEEREMLRNTAEELKRYEAMTGERIEIERGEDDCEKARAASDFLLACLRERRE